MTATDLKSSKAIWITVWLRKDWNILQLKSGQIQIFAGYDFVTDKTKS